MGTGRRSDDGSYDSRATSVGDGDETALLMAMQDFLIDVKGEEMYYPTLFDFKDEDYTNALFGKEIKPANIPPDEAQQKSGMVSSYEEDIRRLKDDHVFGEKAKKSQKYAILLSEGVLLYEEPDVKKRIEYLKDIFESEMFFITLGAMKSTDFSGVEQVGTNGNLLDEHAYAIKSIGEDTITLVESNNPKSLITISIEDFFNKFNIYIYEYPEDMQ